MGVMADERDPIVVHAKIAASVRLRPGEMHVLWPGAATPSDADPFLVARSPDAEWRVVAHTWLEGDAFYLRDISVTPWDGHPIPFSADVLRRLPIPRWTAQAHVRIAGLAKGAMSKGEVQAEVRRLARSKVAPAPGRRGYPRDYYRRLALDYLDLQDKGVVRGIRAELAKRETRRQKKTVTTIQIRDAVSRATELGFLAPGDPGRAGRMPGPNLYQPEGHEAQEGSER